MASQVRCLGCMKTFSDITEMCPHCGYIAGTGPKEAYHLMPGTLIYDRYLVGRAIGYGGFGVTYIGWDTTLQQRVAIKEYLPADYSTRMPGGSDLTIYGGERREEFLAGLLRFLEEARRLAKFTDVDGIVRIQDSFQQNQTGYIVMEYLDGITLKDYLEQKGGTLSYEESVKIILPVLEALEAVHKQGIIHRDISPENIFITHSDEVKLLDFGAARYASTGYSKSLSVILKPGYAPEEQYRSHGNQGPWSDVYAVAATLYCMLTGKVPDEALERKLRDRLKKPSKLGAKLPRNAETAIMNALNVRVEKRTQSAEEFRQQLFSTTQVKRVTEEQKREFGLKMPMWAKIFVAAAALCVVGGVYLLGSGRLMFNFGSATISGKVVDNSDEAVVNVPGIVTMTQNEARKQVEDIGLIFLINGTVESAEVPSGIVMTQTPEPGTEVGAKEKVMVQVSTGPRYTLVPDLTDRLWAECAEEMELVGLEAKVFYEHSDIVPKGSVILQGQEAQKQFPMGGKIKVVVSQGPDEELEKSPISFPDLTGMDYKMAKESLNKLGLCVRKNAVTDSEQPMGSILDCNFKKGEALTTGQTVVLDVSVEKQKILMPNLVYQTQGEAAAILDDYGIAYELQQIESFNVAEGLVMWQNIKAQELVVPDEKVTLVVSSGEAKGIHLDWTNPIEKRNEYLQSLEILDSYAYRENDSVVVTFITACDNPLGFVAYEKELNTTWRHWDDFPAGINRVQFELDYDQLYHLKTLGVDFKQPIGAFNLNFNRKSSIYLNANEMVRLREEGGVSVENGIPLSYTVSNELANAGETVEIYGYRAYKTNNGSYRFELDFKAPQGMRMASFFPPDKGLEGYGTTTGNRQKLVFTRTEQELRSNRELAVNIVTSDSNRFFIHIIINQMPL